MKHIFILNPAAGRDHQNTAALLESKLREYGDRITYELYTTTGRGDATRFVRERAEAEPAEALRFYACGGDGTINEIANSARK